MTGSASLDSLGVVSYSALEMGQATAVDLLDSRWSRTSRTLGPRRSLSKRPRVPCCWDRMWGTRCRVSLELVVVTMSTYPAVSCQGEQAEAGRNFILSRATR